MSEGVGKSGRKVYKKGTVLLTEKPFAFVLSGSFHSERCDYCFKKCALLKCSGCSYAHYCDRHCQKKGWVYHKMECPNIRKIAPKKVPDTIRLMARLIYRLKKYGAQGDSVGLQKRPRTFYDLMSHSEEIRNDPSRMKSLHMVQYLLEEYMEKYLVPHTENLLEIFGRMIINTFVILDENLKTVGTGLYLEASVFDHSCVPSAVNVFYGTTISIRTIVDLDSIQFSDIYISYKNFLDLPSKRQKYFTELYYFLCQCKKCTDLEEIKEMTCIICPNESCASAILGGLAETTPTCQSCKLEIPSETLEEMREVAAFTEENLDKMEEIAYLDICRVCLRKQQHLFHPMNIYNVKVLSMAFESCIGLEKWEEAYMYGMKAKDYMRKYYGELNVTFGLFMAKLGRIAGLLNKLDEERKFTAEGAGILIPALGTSHPFIMNEVLPDLSNLSTI